jgi:hypothetical protein
MFNVRYVETLPQIMFNAVKPSFTLSSDLTVSDRVRPHGALQSDLEVLAMIRLEPGNPRQRRHCQTVISKPALRLYGQAVGGNEAWANTSGDDVIVRPNPQLSL